MKKSEFPNWDTFIKRTLSGKDKPSKDRDSKGRKEKPTRSLIDKL